MFQQQSSQIPSADEREIDRMYYDSMEDELKINLDEEVPAPPIAISFGTHTYTNIRGTFTEPSAIGTEISVSYKPHQNLTNHILFLFL